MSVFGINKKVKYVLSQAEVFEILDLKLASHSLFFFWREGLFVCFLILSAQNLVELDHLLLRKLKRILTGMSK